MKNNENRLQNVARILRNWKGADAAEEPSPNAVAEEIDRMYQEYVASLPARTLAIRQAQEESEREAA
jgi:hypothetical protein